MRKIIIQSVLLLVFVGVNFSFASAPELKSTNNICYKSRDIMFGKEDVFEALKKTLMQSNLNIVTVTKDDGVLTAKGSQINEDTITDITISVSFKEHVKGTTHVTTIASYNTMEEQSDIAQLGAAGISLPIPVPLTGKYAMTGSGNIDDSKWYQGFYTSLDIVLFETQMKYIQSEAPSVDPVEQELIEDVYEDIEKSGDNNTTKSQDSNSTT